MAWAAARSGWVYDTDGRTGRLNAAFVLRSKQDVRFGGG